MAFSFSPYKNTETVISPNGAKTFGLMKKFNFLDRNKIPEGDIIQIFVRGDRAGRTGFII